MKRKLLALLLCASIGLSICACGDSNKKGTENVSENTESTEEVVEITDADLPKLKELADYSDFKAILTEEALTTEDEVSQGFTSFFANAGIGLVEVTDRDTIQDGDIVKVDYTGYESGEAFEGGSAKDQYIDVTNNCGIDGSTGAATGGFIEEFTSALLGAKVGETINGDVTFPEKYQNEDLAGKPATFEFKIHGIYVQADETTVTDAMVAENFKEIYDVSTVAELKQYIEDEMNCAVVLQYLMENSSFEVSDKYIDYRLYHYGKLWDTLVKESYGDSVDADMYFSSMYGYSLEKMKELWKEDVTEQIKYELLYEELAKKESLTLDEEAVKEYIVTVFSQEMVDDNIERCYQSAGLGNAEDGKIYLENRAKVNKFIMDKYKTAFSEAK
ncbi:MAG: FKBP-type peptidyl-prolyl cis-trans isomerase [Lachnospiraceae bacterium]|nr:FKBP-type peptidyl-prolyl cis-trans isomerase [Lachnospiraceae bacterium]